MSREENCTYLAVLNEKQREAVLHFGSPLLILAGAGSGKTRVITTKIAYLVDHLKEDPRSILAVTFTNKAAVEMKERAQALVPEADRVMIRTFHSFGAWLLRRNAHILDLPARFTIYDEDESMALLKRALPEKLPLAQLKGLARLISRAKDDCLFPGDVSGSNLTGFPGLGVDFPDLYRRYQEYLRETGSLDFGDLLMQSVRLLRDFHEVKKRISGRFRIILVDEYQDSNLAQFKLLCELYDEETYLCVVGDEDQSIYGFRGAEIKNILNFAEAFPGTTIIRLEENYRSTQNILKVATGVVENNINRLGKTLWTRKPAGAPVVFALLEDQDREAQFCADLLRDGKYGNTAILYRMNSQSRVFETLFKRLGIPYRVVGTVGFYEREEVKDALAYLTLLVNPKDEIAFRRVVNKPRRGVGAKSVEKIVQARKEGATDLVEAAGMVLPSLSVKGTSGLKALLSMLESFQRSLIKKSFASLSGLVKAVIKDTGLYEHYRELDEVEKKGKVQNLEELVNDTVEFSGSQEGLLHYLEDTGLDRSRGNPFQKSNQVTLITVHNTKGLEFERVIITGLEDGIFPHYSSTVEGLPVAGDDLEEERRLFYVGATRARETLFLTAAGRRRIFGIYKDCEPSLFLKEIPPEALHSYRSPLNTPSDDGFPLGGGVYHDEYGTGIITRKWAREGNMAVVVRFDSGQIASFVLKYAKLERISRDP